jgi:hypothetical protein
MGAVVDAKEMMWVYGENTQGELGLGDKTPRVNPYPLI